MHLVVGPDDNLSQARVGSAVGKGACVGLLWHHANALIEHPEGMLVLLAFLIMPQLVEKIIAAKYGVNNGSAEPAGK